MRLSNGDPTTRSEALKVAEDVTLDELDELLGLGEWVTIFFPNRPRRTVVAAGEPRVGFPSNGPRRLRMAYSYFCRKGTNGDTLDVSHGTRRADIDPVFHFHNLGRIVRLSAEES